MKKYRIIIKEEWEREARHICSESKLEAKQLMQGFVSTGKGWTIKTSIRLVKRSRAAGWKVEEMV